MVTIYGSVTLYPLHPASITVGLGLAEREECGSSFGIFRQHMRRENIFLNLICLQGNQSTSLTMKSDDS